MSKFVPRQRKHKVRRREAETEKVSANTNQIQIVPQTPSEREEKRRKLKEELKAGQEKISRKQLKRLDKYIETQLKKDENLELLKKLSLTKFDTSRLQSSKHLGKRKFEEYVESRPGVDGHARQAQQHVAGELAEADSDVESRSEE